MGGLDVVVDEVAEQRALEPPLGIGLRVGGDIAELGGDGLAHSQRFLLSVELRRDELKVDEGTLLVLDDLRLLRHHAYVGGIAVALVVDNHGKLAGHHRLYLLGQRVVAIEVALHEVGQVELRRRLHGERHGIELTGHLQAGVGVNVVERATERIVDRLVGSGILRRDEEDGSRTGAVCTQVPAALHIEVALKHLQALGVHLKLLVGSHHACLLVDDLQLQFHVGHGIFLVAVAHRERTTECLTRHRHGLVNLQGDGCADAATGFLHILIEFLCKFLVHGRNILIHTTLISKTSV